MPLESIATYGDTIGIEKYWTANTSMKCASISVISFDLLRAGLSASPFSILEATKNIRFFLLGELPLKLNFESVTFGCLNSYFFVWEPELLEMLAEDLGVSVPVVEVVSRLEL